MAATVVSLPLPEPALSAENPAEARKRRREILASQRGSTSTPDSMAAESASACKKRKVVSDVPSSAPAVVSPVTPAKKPVMSKTTGKAKKPQLKYDPDVPMTKEEAAAWRREQRRKRNRESAAASRQRQRDRIVELEAEVEEWKTKFDEVMNRIRQLEEAAASGSSAVQGTQQKPEQEQEEKKMETDSVTDSFPTEPVSEPLNTLSPEALVEAVFKDTIMISPSSSPVHSPRSVSPSSSPVTFKHKVEAVEVYSNGASQVHSEEEEEEPQPSKMISRPAQSRIIHT
jgi:hypothetical protein